MMQSSNQRDHKLITEINIVPYIDMMLILLIIFMITAPLLTQNIKIDLPKTNTEPLPPDDTKPLILNIDAHSNLYLNLDKNEESPISEDVVRDRIATILHHEPKTPILMKANQTVPYKRVVTNMVLLQEAGTEKVGFITDPTETKQPKH